MVPCSEPGLRTGKTGCCRDWRQGQNLAFERAKRAAAEIGDRVVFRQIDTFNRDNFLEWGIYDALFIDGKEVRTGPPPSYEKIVRAIEKKVKRL